MDIKDFEKAGNQLKIGYKRQLQDLLVQGFTFFEYDFVYDCFQEVADIVSENYMPHVDPVQDVIDSSHDMGENLPF